MELGGDMSTLLCEWRHIKHVKKPKPALMHCLLPSYFISSKLTTGVASIGILDGEENGCVHVELKRLSGY